MPVVIFGASGLIGSSLRAQLARAGCEVISVFRSSPPPPLGAAEKTVKWGEITAGHLPDNAQLVILTGAPIAAARWSRARKAQLIESRCGPLKSLLQWIATSRGTPRRAICASAVGIYPTGEKRIWDEESSLDLVRGRSPFLESLCRQWERASQDLEQFTSVTRLRLGAVLAPNGGLLQSLLPWFGRGLALRFGRGEQPLPWIHIGDVCRAICDQLGSSAQHLRLINAVAPHRIDQATFCRILRAQLRARFQLSLPAPLLRLSLGQRADLILTGSDVVSRHLSPDDFLFPTLTSAIADCCSRASDAGLKFPQVSLPMPKKTPETGTSPLGLPAPERHLLLTSSMRNRGSPPKSTQITVRCDCGFGNALYVRGEGAQLRWDRGAVLTNTGPDTWIWQSALAFGDCEFKILLNDRHFERGPNRQLACGQSVDLTPQFEGV